MNKLYSFLTTLVVLSMLSTLFAGKVGATDEPLRIAGTSGLLLTSGKVSVRDYRAAKLTAFLKKYNSPLAIYANDFVAYADKYNLDYRLVPAISGVESTFGQALPYNSYNAYGWNGGKYAFKDWKDGIAVVSQTLRENYMDKWHAQTIPAIGRIYAPPSTTWANKVQYFMQQIEDTKVADTQLVSLTI